MGLFQRKKGFHRPFGLHAGKILTAALQPGALRFVERMTMSAHHDAHHDASNDVVEEIVPMMPIVLPLAGAVLMFLLAFIAVTMA